MNTFVVYDATTGEVIMTQSGDRTFPSAVNCGVVNVPDGKLVESVKVETGEVILIDIPLSETEQRLANLEAQIATLAGTEV